MIESKPNSTLNRLILIGPAAVTLLVFSQGVTDPVNVTKFFAIGVLAFGMFFAVTVHPIRSFWSENKFVLMLLMGFSAASVNALINSDAPISQSLYGVYGRNNGFLLYVFLILIFLSTLHSKDTKSHINLVKSLKFAGYVNLIYCLWVITFGDFIGWSNPYGNILGTLGNPNFIGAFLGMFSSILISFSIANRKDVKKLSLYLVFLTITLFEIYKSHAIQGRVLFVAGLLINLIFWIKVRFSRTIFTLIAIVISAAIAITGILGALQKGPFASLLYKDSVSLRGQYWYAGLQMGIHNLWSGVGFDSYGDWYRYFRRPSALIRPGVDTVSNTAHNVYIDLFAFGGLPLILTYVALNIYVFISILKIFTRTKEFDLTFISLSSAWICYQLQSIISINQVGLAIWGWILGASLVAYCRTTRSVIAPRLSRSHKNDSGTIITSSLRAGLGLLVGAMIAVPPLSSDMQWRSAQLSQNASVVEKVLISTYLNPANTFKTVNIVGAFHESGIDDLAYLYAKKAVKDNPNNFESWRLLTLIRQSQETDRELALKEMKRLDPLNPEISLIAR